MLLQLRLGGDRYVLDARWVVEVIPRVALKQLPRVPPWVAGVMNYRSVPVTVIDFSRLAEGAGAAAALSTRIVVLDCPTDGGTGRRIGLLVEGATELLRACDLAFLPGAEVADAPYLGRVAGDAQGLIQEIRPEGLPVAGLQGGVRVQEAPSEALPV